MSHSSRFPPIIGTVFIILAPPFPVRASNNMLITSMPLLTRYDFGFSQTQVGIIEALMALTAFLSAVFVNARLNATQRRLAFISSTAAFSVLLMGFSVSGGISVWLLSAASGAAFGFIMPNIITSASLIEDVRTRERVLSLYTLSLSLSLIAGPALESYLLRIITLKESYLIFAILGAVATFLAPLIRFPVEPVSGGERTRVWSNPGFQASVYNSLAYGIPFYVLIAFGGIYEVETFHISLSLVTLLFSLFFLTSFLARLCYSVWPPKRITRHMAMAVALTIIGIVLMVASNSLSLFMVSLLMLGVPHGLTYPLSVISINISFTPQQRNVANSLFFSVFMIVGTVLPLVSGLSIDHIGFKGTFLAILAAVIVVALLMSNSFRHWKSTAAS